MTFDLAASGAARAIGFAYFDGPDVSMDTGPLGGAWTMKAAGLRWWIATGNLRLGWSSGRPAIGWVVHVAKVTGWRTRPSLVEELP
jgi:hypothetical protein